MMYWNIHKDDISDAGGVYAAEGRFDIGEFIGEGGTGFAGD